jgi:hypothetical protein
VHQTLCNAGWKKVFNFTGKNIFLGRRKKKKA